jgi:hypothetical protein
MNTTTHAPAEVITPNFDKTVDAKDFKFRFKKDKLDNQRPTVEIKAGIPSVEGIVNILEAGGKGLELLQEAMYDVVRGAIGGWVSENETASQATFDPAKFTWEAIANQPREDRRASSIPEELWTEFATDYQEVMPGVTGKSKDAVANATVVYLKKFSIVKTNKEVLAKLKDQISLYVEHSKKAEQFSDIIELLLKKVDTYLGANDVELLVQNL